MFCPACYNIYVCVQHIPGNCFQDAYFKELAAEAKAAPESISAWPSQAFTVNSCSSAIMVSPNQHVKHTNQDKWLTYLSALILTLLLYQQHFWCYSNSVLINHNPYKTFKVYSAAICLMHIELISQWTRPSIWFVKEYAVSRALGKVDILKALKSHLRLSTLGYTLCKQCMLWSSFTLSFYSFLCSRMFIFNLVRHYHG